MKIIGRMEDGTDTIQRIGDKRHQPPLGMQIWQLIEWCNRNDHWHIVKYKEILVQGMRKLNNGLLQEKAVQFEKNRRH
jgi:hypothetical protein